MREERRPSMQRTECNSDYKTMHGAVDWLGRRLVVVTVILLLSLLTIVCNRVRNPSTVQVTVGKVVNNGDNATTPAKHPHNNGGERPSPAEASTKEATSVAATPAPSTPKETNSHNQSMIVFPKNATATGSFASPLPPYPWQIIHPVKTGTSFINVFYMLACPEDYRDNWNQSELEMHSAIPGKGIRQASRECRQRWMNGVGYDFGRTRPSRRKWWLGDHEYLNPALPEKQIFMSMREPVDRMISHLFFDSALDKRGVKSIKTAKTDLDVAQVILQHKYLHTPRLAQHMTSFFLPQHKQRKKQKAPILTESLAEKACQTVWNVASVVFVDDYNRSICLLHTLFDFPHHPSELKNNRPTIGRGKSINVTTIGVLVRNQTSLLDDIVYNCARERFLRDLKKWAPNCL